ncbi:MAG: isopeptide-forming domain-containing fimbrial protein [Clostridia bacterium]|nr:isopeptide-forming domain-containing fimbrial protein [Clostridia bacterium]
MKKILALALALMMVFSLATTAFAAEDNDPNTFTITITAPANGSLTNHTYAVYQIFTGKLFVDNKGNEDTADDETILSDIVYGKNYGTEGEEVPETVLTTLAGMSGEAAAKKLNGEKKGDLFARLDASNSWTYENAPAGYYLIVDVSSNLPQGETSSAFVLELIDDAEITSKHTAGPVVEKKIKDINDSLANSTTEWQDSADHDIGDAIPFQLKMTVPANFADFKEYGEAYRFVFHDTEEPGLTFQQNSVKVFVDGSEITTGFEVVYPTDHKNDDDTFDVVFADLTKIGSVQVGSVITVEYASILNEKAILGSQGNVNTVYGEYSNLHRPDYPGRTPDDSVIAFTYKVVVNKVDEAGAALAGAEFTLEKFVKVLPEGKTATETVYAAEDNQTIVGYWIAVDQVETEPGTVFTFTGLDDGNYRLTESKTPDGYNTIDPIEFTVTADHDIKWETPRTEMLNSLNGNKATGEVRQITFTASDDKGTLTTDVINKAGTVLPETGGMGTTIFYAVGGVLVVAAVVLLVTKKRASSAK